MKSRSVSGHFPSEPHQNQDIPIMMVKTRMAQSSSRINVFQETEQFYRKQFSLDGNEGCNLAELKSFEMNLRRKVSERYSGETRGIARGMTRVPRGLCKSVQTLVTAGNEARCNKKARPHSVDVDTMGVYNGGHLGMFDVPGHRIVPCQRVIVRSCDEPYEEFRKVGIGSCFKGN